MASGAKIKGIDILLSQLDNIKHPCLVCGNAEAEFNKFKDYPKITYGGMLADMRQLYAKSKCHLVLSQIPEAFGRTTVEAGINGIPVVAFDSGACREVVGDAGVIISKAKDLPSAIEKAITIDPEVCRANAKRFEAEPQIQSVMKLLSAIS